MLRCPLKIVEIIRSLAHQINHQRVTRNDIGDKIIQSKAAITTSNELGRSDRVSTCKERLVPTLHELFS